MSKLFPLILIVGLFILGCTSGNDGIGTVVPNNQDIESNSSSAVIIGATEADSVFDAIGLLGSYELILDAVNMKADLHPSRSAAIGESYIVSGKGFFSVSPCADCLKIRSIEMTEDEDVKMTFDIRHPFQPGDPSKPPTWLNRLDLDVFDVALVVAPQGVTPPYYPDSGISAYANVIENASGYTRELSHVVNNNNAMPYVLVVDDNKSGTNTYNEFPMGTQSAFDVLFSHELSNTITMDMFLTMGYGASAKKFQRLNPSYFNPEFNKKAAWKIEVIPPEGDGPAAYGNTWSETDNTTEYYVTVKVWDWQHGYTSIANPPVQPWDIAYPSDVASVNVEIPGMTFNLPTTATPLSGMGMDPADPLIFTIPIANEKLLSQGEYEGLVKVTDERVPPTSSIAFEANTLVHSENGIELEWFSIPEFATYQTFTATVTYGNGGNECSAVGSITYPIGEEYDAYSGEVVDFTVSAVPDGGNIITYWAGVNGNYTASDSKGEFSHQFIDSDCPEFADDSYTLSFGVELDCNPGNIIFIDSIIVNVTSCSTNPNPVPPVQDLVLTVNRYGLISEYAINEDYPFTLTWEHPGGEAHDFAIYWDNDPTDGLTNNLEFLGTTMSTNWIAPASHLNILGSHYVPGNTYAIFARNSEGVEDNQGRYAHVIVAGIETVPGNNLHYNYEGWSGNNQLGNTNFSYALPFTTTTDPAHGSYSVRFGYRLGGSVVGNWEGISIETPTVPGATARFIDFSMKCNRSGNDGYWKRNGGMLIGTCPPPQPGPGFSNPGSIDVAKAKEDDGYRSYMADDPYVDSEFENTPDGDNCWRWSYIPQEYRYKCGGDLDHPVNGGNPYDNYAVIEICQEEIFSGPKYPMIFIDDIAIAIF